MTFPRLNYKNLSPMQTVEAIYQLMLNRPIDATGKATWTSAIENGEYSRYKQIKLIARSDEFLVTFDNISRAERLRRRYASKLADDFEIFDKCVLPVAYQRIVLCVGFARIFIDRLSRFRPVKHQIIELGNSLLVPFQFVHVFPLFVSSDEA